MIPSLVCAFRTSQDIACRAAGVIDRGRFYACGEA